MCLKPNIIRWVLRWILFFGTLVIQHAYSLSHSIMLNQTKKITLKMAPKAIEVEDGSIVYVSKSLEANTILVQGTKAGKTNLRLLHANGKTSQIEVNVKDESLAIHNQYPKTQLSSKVEADHLLRFVSQSVLETCGLDNFVESKMIYITESPVSEASLLCLWKLRVHSNVAMLISRGLSKEMLTAWQNSILAYLGVSKSDSKVTIDDDFLKIQLDVKETEELKRKAKTIMDFCSCVQIHVNQKVNQNELMLKLRLLELSKSAALAIGTELGQSGLELGLAEISLPKGGMDLGQSQLPFLFKALEDKGELQFLAEPSLWVREGTKAEFQSGGEFPVEFVNPSDKNGQAHVIYKNFGVLFNVTLEKVEHEVAWLQVEAEMSDPDTTLSSVSSPALRTRRVRTMLQLGKSRTALISGFNTQKEAQEVSQVPVLSSIPILGHLFQFKKKQKSQALVWMILENMGSTQIQKPLERGELPKLDLLSPQNEKR